MNKFAFANYEQQKTSDPITLEETLKDLKKYLQLKWTFYFEAVEYEEALFAHKVKSIKNKDKYMKYKSYTEICESMKQILRDSNIL